MKKPLTAITLLAGGVSLLAQGEIDFNGYTANLKLAVYNQQPPSSSTFAVTYGGYTTYEQVGNSSIDIPQGNIVYLNGPGLSGTGYDAQLLVGPAGITSANATIGGAGLMPYGPPLNFSAAGFISGSEVIVLPPLDFFDEGEQVAIAIAAWNNQAGSLSTLAAAQAAESPWGISPVEQTTGRVGLSNVAQALPTTLESFSLGVNTVPEPNTIALGVMGVTAFLPRRK